MPYELRLEQLSNKYTTLVTDSPYPELNRVFGAVNRDGRYYFPAENPFLSYVLNDISKLKSRDELALSPELLTQLGQESDRFLYSDTIDIPQIGKTALLPHQIRACQKSFSSSRFGLFMDCRTGKTLCMLYTIAHYAKQENIKALIVGPRISCENWLKEIDKHEFPLTALSIYGETASKRKKLFEQSLDPKYSIVTTSFENLRILQDEVKATLPYNFLVVDEAHRVKSMKASRTKALLNISDKARYRYLLTGTPTLGSATDMYAQMRILSPHIFFNWDYYRFTKFFIVYSKPRLVSNKDGSKRLDSKRYPVGEKNIGVLNSLITPMSIRIRRNECEGLPDREEVFLKYDLTKEQKELYASVVNNDRYVIDGKEYILTSPALKYTKLTQISSGFLYYQDEENPKNRKIHVFSENPKLSMLEEYIEDYLANPDNKIIIWTNYDQEQEFISDRFSKYGLLELRGKKGLDPFEVTQQFNDDPAIKILSAKQTMGISVDMSCASTSFNFSRSPSLDSDIQSKNRIDGLAQKKEKISFYYFTSPNLIDDHTHAIINSKINLDAALTNVNMKCIGCKNLSNCLVKGIKYGTSKCQYSAVLV